jgi:lipoteichoic acid synthase
MQKRKVSNQVLFALYFAFSAVYLEFVFRLATVGNPGKPGFLYGALFAVAYSAIGYLLSSATKKETINRLIAAVVLFATSVLYIVQFLIYKQFKQFYDINTMAGGAGDALTSYFAELLDLLFPQGGIYVVLLMLVPFAAYLVLSRFWLFACGANWAVRAVTFGAAVALYLVALLLTMHHPVYGPVYDQQYSFQSAVSELGLLTGLRLDIKNTLFGQTYDFESQDALSDIPGEIKVIAQQTVELEEPETVYGYNKLLLDFAALNNNATRKQKELNAYVSSLIPSKKNAYTGLFKGKNLILITAEAFSAELIDPELTPTLYRLANKGIRFTDYYQPASAGTTGGEYQNLFGMLPTAGGKSFKNTATKRNYLTIASQLDRLGYYGKAFHNNSYTYYDRNKTHINIGYSDGFMGYGNGMEQYVQKNWPQSDNEMFTGTLSTYIDKQPFSVYYMTVSGHSGYSTSGNAMTRRHWDRVKHLPYSSAVKGYFAANLDFEDALANLVKTLEEKGIADDAVICIGTDHFPYGLDSGGTLGNMPYLSELYGYNVTNYFERDHSRLIIWSGCLEKMDPITVETPTSSLDILPTLSNLFGTEFDSRLMPGRDVFSDAPALVFNTNYDWKTELGTYYASSARFVPAGADVVIPDGYVDSIKSVVRNKINYCSGALSTDYFRLLFG